MVSDARRDGLADPPRLRRRHGRTARLRPRSRSLDLPRLRRWRGLRHSPGRPCGPVSAAPSSRSASLGCALVAGLSTRPGCAVGVVSGTRLDGLADPPRLRHRRGPHRSAAPSLAVCRPAPAAPSGVVSEARLHGLADPPRLRHRRGPLRSAAPSLATRHPPAAAAGPLVYRCRRRGLSPEETSTKDHAMLGIASKAEGAHPTHITYAEGEITE